jgi:hypothetical protein
MSNHRARHCGSPRSVKRQHLVLPTIAAAVGVLLALRLYRITGPALPHIGPLAASPSGRPGLRSQSSNIELKIYVAMIYWVHEA